MARGGEKNIHTLSEEVLYLKGTDKWSYSEDGATEINRKEERESQEKKKYSV